MKVSTHANAAHDRGWYDSFQSPLPVHSINDFRSLLQIHQLLPYSLFMLTTHHASWLPLLPQVDLFIRKCSFLKLRPRRESNECAVLMYKTLYASLLGWQQAKRRKLLMTPRFHLQSCVWQRCHGNFISCSIVLALNAHADNLLTVKLLSTGKISNKIHGFLTQDLVALSPYIHLLTLAYLRRYSNTDIWGSLSWYFIRLMIEIKETATEG